MSFALEATAPMTLPLVELLFQLADVVARLSDEQYTQRPVGAVDGSVGGHVRHCLDHVQALVAAADTGQLDYDHRTRDGQIERSRYAAQELISSMARELSEMPDSAMDRDVELSVLLSPDEPPIEVRTTVGRELAYVLSHTVHHNALIAAMVRTLGGWLPKHFGYAPSTIRHARTQVCAR